MTASRAVQTQLSANAEWLRGLARALVGDAAADDLVQETMVAAIENPPATDRPMRPWLGAVLRNVARMRWRSGSRRTRRERVAGEHAHGTAEPERPDSALARVQTQKRITDAVLTLDEPYRETVLLRFAEGLSAAEISRRQGVVATTVRSRLSRGLDQLRTTLRDHEGEGRWQLALAPLLVPVKPASIAAPVLGGLAMKAMIAIAAGAAGIIVYTAARGDESPRPAPPADHAVAVAERGNTGTRTASADAPAERVRPVPGQPRKFASLDERERFAAALAAARAHRDKVAKKHYDLSGSAVTRERLELANRKPGKLDKSYIRDRVREIVPLIAECYDLAREGAPGLRGQLTVNFTIDAEEEVGGYVAEAAVDEGSPLQHPLLSECVTETILSLEFVPPEGGGLVKVRYPFVFEPAPPDKDE